MHNFDIEDGILKDYYGESRVVVVPDGVVRIGGILTPADKECGLWGYASRYRAFYCNKHVEELYLPDSVEKIGFKALEHCRSLRVLSFSNKMKEFECNAINGCTALRTILYRGTIYEFSCLETPGQTPDLEVVYCTDGEIHFGKDRKYYIETLFYPSTRDEWEKRFPPDDWRRRRCKRIICADEL